eukprot:3825337-Alexandrium_andersonii.AAC.1
MVHLDDFIFAGNEEEPKWRTLLARIKALYERGSWGHGDVTQCGVLIKEDLGGFILSQTDFALK